MTATPTPDRTVILVDDDESDLTLSKTLLQKAGGIGNIGTFTHGEDVIEYLTHLEPGAALPLAIVLDVKMPGFTGLDLLEWIREHPAFDAMPVVMWSSSDDPRDILRAAKLGAQCYFGKYPPVPLVREMVAEAAMYRPGVHAGRFFRIAGNLLLGRDGLPDLSV